MVGLAVMFLIPARLANQLDFRKTYINCFTAGPAGMRRARMPMVLPDEDLRERAERALGGDVDVAAVQPVLHFEEGGASDDVLPLQRVVVTTLLLVLIVAFTAEAAVMIVLPSSRRHVVGWPRYWPSSRSTTTWR